MTEIKFEPWPCFTTEEADIVREVLLSNRVNYWTGRHVREFEKEFAAAVGCKYSVALANGTLALDLALRALGIDDGDEVVVTPRTFIASASCIVNAGATPVFADVDANSQNITAESIRKVLTARTKAVVCVHLAGWPCDMDPILELARKRGLWVIEDCAQAHGARYKGRPVGSLGDVAAWSFCQDKIMTTGGEGGMLTTNDHGIWKAAWSYKDHGKSWDAVHSLEHRAGFRWLHESFGTNWRMMEMQAAIGRIQTRRLPDLIGRRRANAGLLHNCFLRLRGLRVTTPPSDVVHSFYKYYAFIRPERLKSGWSRDKVMTAIQKHGVPCFSGACPEVYLEKAFQNAGLAPLKRLPVAKELGETSLMFVVHPTLNVDHMNRTIEVAEKVMHKATAF